MVAVVRTSTVEVAIHRVHAAWLHDARAFLQPALAPNADFWTRWAAVRYLSDGFAGRLEMECELVDQLRLVLPGRLAERLAAGRDAV